MSQALEKWASSADAWIARAKEGDLNRTLLLDAPMLAAAGDVAGKQVLDVGCGEGRFCRILSGYGAQTTGLDPIEKLLTAARAEHPQGSYVQGVAEALPFSKESFDMVVSYLTMIDIPDFRAAINEIARVLRPGGQVLVANLNSFTTTRTQAWYADASGKRLHVAVDDYFDEKAHVVEWSGISVINYHRPMEAYMTAYLEADFRLEHYQEPRLAPELVADHPGMANAFRVPYFHIMRWRK